MQTREEKIENFLTSLGEVKKNDESKDGFTVVCRKCESSNFTIYNDIACGSEYTGCWGGSGIKCKDCGNAAEVYHA